MKTCGNCGTECPSYLRAAKGICRDWTKGEPPELQRAQWWFCGWRRWKPNFNEYQRVPTVSRRRYISDNRMFDAIRAQARKGT